MQEPPPNHSFLLNRCSSKQCSPAGILVPDLHPTDTPLFPPPLLVGSAQGDWPAPSFQCPSGAHLTLIKQVRQIEGLWVRQTLMWQGVGEGTPQPAPPSPPAQLCFFYLCPSHTGSWGHPHKVTAPLLGKGTLRGVRVWKRIPQALPNGHPQRNRGSPRQPVLLPRCVDRPGMPSPKMEAAAWGWRSREGVGGGGRW